MRGRRTRRGGSRRRLAQGPAARRGQWHRAPARGSACLPWPLLRSRFLPFPRTAAVYFVVPRVRVGMRQENAVVAVHVSRGLRFYLGWLNGPRDGLNPLDILPVQCPSTKKKKEQKEKP
jgi:hypothetical protein